jgi:hypothetical protein
MSSKKTTKKSTKVKKSAPKKAVSPAPEKKRGAAEFIRSLSPEMSIADVVAECDAHGFQVSASYVSNVRGLARKRAGMPPGKPGRKPGASVKPIHAVARLGAGAETFEGLLQRHNDELKAWLAGRLA